MRSSRATRRLTIASLGRPSASGSHFILELDAPWDRQNRRSWQAYRRIATDFDERVGPPKSVIAALDAQEEA